MVGLLDPDDPRGRRGLLGLDAPPLAITPPPESGITPPAPAWVDPVLDIGRAAAEGYGSGEFWTSPEAREKVANMDPYGFGRFILAPTGDIIGAGLGALGAFGRGSQEATYQAIKPIDPSLARDVAAIPEAFAGSPHAMVPPEGALPAFSDWWSDVGPVDSGALRLRGLTIDPLSPDAEPDGPRLNPDAVGFNDRISTRLPSKTPDVHDVPDYTVGKPAFDAASGPYPGRVQEVIPRHIGVTDASTEGFLDHLTGNIRALWDAVPDTWKGDAMGWYRGARSLAEQMADRFGTSVRAQAANLAALSPQRAWDHNVEQSMRVGDIVANQSKTPWNDALEQAWSSTDEDNPGFSVTNPNWQKHYDLAQGNALGDVTDPQAAALWVRLFDRANAPDNNVRIVHPDGTRSGLLMNDDEVTPAKLQWGSLHAVGNAIKVLRDDSLPTISDAMGDAHKVRNFYNNIVSPDAGHDVTVDTHAISAALLRPLGSSQPEVSYGLGSPVDKRYTQAETDPWPTTMNNAPQGLAGMYPLYAEAYRRVARDLNVLPRELQSVTWEGIKQLYNPADRRDADLMTSNTNAWRDVSNGVKTAADVRRELLSRGIGNPKWFQQRQP